MARWHFWPWLLAALVAVDACTGTPFRAKAPEPAPPDGLATIEPVAFSPDDDLNGLATADGRRVVYVGQENGNLDVWVRDYGRNSTYPLTLNPADDFDPAISPDGQRLVFASRRSDAKGDLYLSEGFEPEAGLVQLTGDESGERQPVFSVDGTIVYYTSAGGVGAEQIYGLRLEDRLPFPLSPTPGFDPAVSPDGRYLIYTAPAEGRFHHPHLLALRLSDSATRAITGAEVPEGFARFIDARTLAFVRFVDDDNQDGLLDANDQASLWRARPELDALFRGQRAPVRPEPLTNGSEDELFPSGSNGYLYFTQGTRQQDVVRLPVAGLFPEYEAPAQYFELVRSLDDPRTQAFALRKAAARAGPGTRVEAEAQLQIGRLAQIQDRPDLAQVAYRRLIDQAAVEDRGEILGLAEAELIALRRAQELERASTPEARLQLLARWRQAGEALRARNQQYPSVVARIELELAELVLLNGDRPGAISALEALVQAHPGQTETAARASLRRIELLGIAHDPDALGEAYAEVIGRFPEEREVVKDAARRLVSTHLADLAKGEGWRAEVDVLRRLIPRYGSSPVRTKARARLAQLLREHKAYGDASLELQQILIEESQDRYASARTLLALAEVDEAQGAYDQAIESWTKVRSSFGDLPGYTATSRQALTRLNLLRAAALEEAGDKSAARLAYGSVIDNDLTQARAHRRYLALSAETGHLEEALDQAEARAKAQPATPIARYAYGLALSYVDPPDFDRALEEIEEAIRLNPQFTYAYITRGWLREMAELETPSLLASVGQAFVGVMRSMVGGVLDVPIGQSGPLESAIEDYKTALSLNQESISPETESEILLDLANAQYRLADQTRDASNMRSAFDRYLEALQLGSPFTSPVAELVYWERFGRAAAWLEEYGISAMATRRALELAEDLGLKGRLPQLYGNLALAYSQAQEEVYARRALEQFEGALKEQGLEAKLVVSLRNLAFAQLQKGPRTPDALDDILGKLQASRQSLERIKETDRGELPTVWRPLGDDATRAQYGFAKRSELDLNLALAGRAHQALGEESRVAELRARRESLSQEMLDEPDKTICLFFGFAWCTVQVEPVVLGQLQERLGLFTQRSRRAQNLGEGVEAQEALAQATSELEEWSADGRLAADQLAVALDRGRVAALAVEMVAEAGPATEAATPEALEARLSEAEKGLKLALPQTQTGTAALPQAADLEELPTTVSASTAVAILVERALAQPRLPRAQLEVRQVQARLRHARGLLGLWRAARRPPAATELRALLTGLDAQLNDLLAARRDFEAGAIEAATGGPGLGARLLALCLARIAALDRRLARPTTGALEGALDLATRTGDLALEQGLVLGAAAQGGAVGPAEAMLAQALPPYLGASARSVAEVSARTASAALAAGDLGKAFGALDRWLLLEGAAGGRLRWPVGATVAPMEGSEADRGYLVSLSEKVAVLEDGRARLAELDENSAPEALRGALARVQAARSALLAQVNSGDLSERAAARYLGRSPLDLDGVTFELFPDEALLLYAPLNGQVHGLLVDGSTTAEVRIAHAVLTGAATGLSESLAVIRTAVAADQAPDPALLAQVRAELFDPFADRLRGKRVLLVAGGLLGAPLPAQLFPEGLAPTHLLAPSLIGLFRSGQLGGTIGSVAIGPADEALFEGEQRLEGTAAQQLADRKPPPKLEPGESRSLDELSQAERLLERAKDRVFIDAELSLEPAAPERSAIRLQAADDDDEAGSLADDFLKQLPLEAVAVPARTYVLGRVRGERRALYGLDLSLLSQGAATTLVFPASLPAPVTQRIWQAYQRQETELGPARSLRAAVAAEWDTTPNAGQVVLLGAPGLDEKGSRLWSAQKLAEARTQALVAINKGRYSEAVSRLERWIRLQQLAGKDEQVEAAYGALVGIFRERLEPPEPVRGIEAQRALLAFLESKKKSGRKVIDAQLELALLYGQAQDYQAAEALFEASLKALEPLDDQEGLARAYFKYGRYKKDAREYEASASLMEQAIARYDRVGAYDRPKVATKKGEPVYPPEAELSLLQVGDTYLNALSDPDRARRAYERVRQRAKTEEERVSAEIDLARVGRRAGDFEAARAHAQIAIDQATQAGLRDLLLSAVIESANVAWYQGNYRLGGVLCQQSLDLVDQLLDAQRKEAALPAAKSGAAPVKKLNRRLLRNGKIYALSVCGLVAMSQRNFEQAKSYLERAKRIAARQGLESEAATLQLVSDREVATQFNNLGRAYLEFGHVDEAIESFLSAKEIDERLNDRYALAYDLRNLGGALAFKKDYATAEETLAKGLEYARLVRDTNNELRALFSLAELAAEMGRAELAKQRYQEALPLARRLGVKELAWQIHRGLGTLAKAAKQPKVAERELVQAIRIARSITGRSAPSDFGPSRYAAFDDLIVLYAEQGRVEDAFSIANQARALEQVELLDDDRIPWASPSVKGALSGVRGAATATAAAADLARLVQEEPRLSEVLRPASVPELIEGLPSDAGMVVYRVLPDRILIFTLDTSGIQVAETKIPADRLQRLLAEYGRQMSLRSEPTQAHLEWAELLLGPIHAWLQNKKRLAIVAHQGLRYIAFPALPISTDPPETLLERMVLVSGLHPIAARRALLDLAPLDLGAIVALGAPEAPVGSSDPPLPYAEREVRSIREQRPAAQVLLGGLVTRAALLEALGSSTGVVHFAGHGFLAGADPRGRFVDPLGGQLRTSDGPVTMLEILGTKSSAELMVLSACSSAIWPRKNAGSSGAEELLSMAQSFQLAGAQRVLATTVHVHDLAASLVMKHFYREAEHADAATALRAAQLKVRQAYPHPSWWASFVLFGG